MSGFPPPGRPGIGSSTTGRRAALVLAAVLALTAALLLALRGPRPLVRDEAAFLAARATVLQEQLGLVKEDARYLLLDPDAGTLTLFQGGAPLRAWPVTAVEVGARRIGSEETGWRTRRWDGVRIEPPVERDRRILVSDSVEPPDLTGAVDWIPPTPEEAVPTPNSFVLHYQGGLGLEVVALRADSDTVSVPVGFLERVEHGMRRLLPRNWDRYRIQVSMPANEAGALYRSLPDSSSLLAIIPPR